MTDLLTPQMKLAAVAVSAGELLTEEAANPRRDAWRLFKKNKAAMLGLGWAIHLRLWPSLGLGSSVMTRRRSISSLR